MPVPSSSDWKKTIQEGVAGVFERGGADRGEGEFERERDQLKAIIGKPIGDRASIEKPQ